MAKCIECGVSPGTEQRKGRALGRVEGWDKAMEFAAREIDELINFHRPTGARYTGMYEAMERLAAKLRARKSK